MRVLHLTTHLNTGGITTYILKLVPYLKKSGVETFVLSSGGAIAPRFEEKGGTVLELPIKTKSELSPKIYFQIPALIKILRENKIDLMHAHTRVTQVMAAIAGMITGVPYVTTSHGYYKRRLGRRLLPGWGLRTIAISQGVADHLIKDFELPEDRVDVVNNGVDFAELEKFHALYPGSEAKRTYGFAPEDPVVGIVARIVEDKGHEYLLRAAELLKSDLPTLRILIVGEGRHMPYLKNLAKELGIENRVIFTGNVEDIGRPLSAMDIFALPAIWREGFGLSIVEAMAFRKPVIVSNIWALNSLIDNNVTGILLEPKQARPLADAILHLLRSPKEAERIANTGHQMAKSSFTISRMSDEIKQVYEKVLTPRRNS